MRPPLLLWLFPLRRRMRYGDEIRDMYEDSAAPFADWVDLTCAGMRARLEEEMSRLINVALLTIASLSLMAVGYSVAELNDGWREVPAHWWSTTPFVSLVVCIGAWLWLNVMAARARVGANS